MNRQPCRRCCISESGRCILCGLAEHAYCKDEWHRCADGGGKGEYDRYNGKGGAR